MLKAWQRPHTTKWSNRVGKNADANPEAVVCARSLPPQTQNVLNKRLFSQASEPLVLYALALTRE